MTNIDQKRYASIQAVFDQYYLTDFASTTGAVAALALLPNGEISRKNFNRVWDTCFLSYCRRTDVQQPVKVTTSMLKELVAKKLVTVAAPAIDADQVPPGKSTGISSSSSTR